MRQRWHGRCIRLTIMELAIAVIVLIVGLLLERGGADASAVTVRTGRRR